MEVVAKTRNSGLSSVTVEGWFTWFGGGLNNTRIFDFGMSSGAPDGSGGTNSTDFLEDFVLNPGRNYFFLSPQTGNPRFALDPDIGGAGTGETPSITSSIAITVSNKSHFAVVYDFPRGVARLYVNGQRAGTGVATFPLSIVDDRNNWLGRSQWQDPFPNTAIDEFRIYNGPFLDTDIADHFFYGPNTLISFLPRLSFSLSGNQLTLSWPTAAGSYTLKSSGQVGPGAVWNPAGGPATVVGENYQVTVTVTAGNAFGSVLNWFSDATISENATAHPNAAGSFVNVNGGYAPNGVAKPHISPHLKGPRPDGGFLAFKDSHVEWRKFARMEQRASSGRGFWW